MQAHKALYRHNHKEKLGGKRSRRAGQMERVVACLQCKSD